MDGISSSSVSLPASSFDATIPVVDLKDFLSKDPSKVQGFVDKISSAMQEIGFFAVINTGIPSGETENAYGASKQFFALDEETKKKLYRPELNQQRGYIFSENAQSAKQADHKEFLHIGDDNNVWSESVDLERPVMKLKFSLDSLSLSVQQAFARAIRKADDFFVNMTSKGNNNLLRVLHYLPNPDRGAVWATAHTDIDLFTLLPSATEKGLEVQLSNGDWVGVNVPEGAVIVNGGDMLRNLTNGFFKSAVHRVVADPLKPELERYSIVHFIHPANDADLSPISECIDMTGGFQRYPEATRMNLLAARLREISLAGEALKQWERDSQFMEEEVKPLVDSGNAAPEVVTTWDLYEQSLREVPASV